MVAGTSSISSTGTPTDITQDQNHNKATAHEYTPDDAMCVLVATLYFQARPQATLILD